MGEEQGAIVFAYSVKFLCGTQAASCCGCDPLQPGRYRTEINIHNPTARAARVRMRPISLVTGGTVVAREPDFAGPSATSTMRLPAHTATMADCCRIMELVQGAAPSASTGVSVGIVEILSTVELAVTAVYTTGDGGDAPPAIDVQQIAQRPYAGESSSLRSDGPHH